MPNPRQWIVLWLLRIGAPGALLTVALGLMARLWGWPPYPIALSFSGFAMAMAVQAAAIFWDRARPRNASGSGVPDGSLARRRLRLLSSTVIAALFLAFITNLSILCWVTGHCSTYEGPVFVPRQEYFLRWHGERVRVSERDFRIGCTLYEAGWSLIQLLMIVVALHVFYFGQWPFSRSGAEPLEGSMDGHEGNP
jgi:hypothetical protein